MLLKFLKNGKTYECENIEYIDAQKIKVTGKDIPSLDGGFDVINNEIVDNMYNKYVTFYKKNNKDLIFRSTKSRKWIKRKWKDRRICLSCYQSSC